jgi:hypothetical protein
MPSSKDSEVFANSGTLINWAAAKAKIKLVEDRRIAERVARVSLNCSSAPKPTFVHDPTVNVGLYQLPPKLPRVQFKAVDTEAFEKADREWWAAKKAEDDRVHAERVASYRAEIERRFAGRSSNN